MKCDWCPNTRCLKFPKPFEKVPGHCHKGNPGNIENLHSLCKSLLPNYTDGLELTYKHTLAPNKSITGNWILSHTRPSGFRFGGSYAWPITEDVLGTPVITADINPTTLATNAEILYYPFDSLRYKATLQRADPQKPLTSKNTLEHLRPCSTWSLNLYDVNSNSGRMTLSYLRAATLHLALGVEMLLEWRQPRTMVADTAFAARYTNFNYSVAGTFSRHGTDISYWQRIHQNIQMGTLFGYQRKIQKSVGTICSQWDFGEAFVRSMFDSDLNVGFEYVKFLQHIPCSLGISLCMSLPTNRFIFGVKLCLDPAGFARGD